MRPKETYNYGVQHQQHQPLVIAPSSGNLKFRRSYAWFLFAIILLLAVLACLIWSKGYHSSALIFLVEIFGMTALLWWFKRQNKEKRVGETAVASPAILLDADGLVVLGSPAIGPILWEEIRGVRGSHFLGLPTIKLELDFWTVARRLGARNPWLWMAWVPGGIAINAVPFGGKGKLVAEQINAYRAALDTVADGNI